MGGASTKPATGGSGGSSSNGTKIKKNVTNKQMLIKAPSSPAVGLLPDSSGWTSPYRFRELYDVESDQIHLIPGSNTDALSPTAKVSAENATREHMNELFFSIATNTQWQQQQVRGLFAVYKKCCLLTDDRVLNYTAFCQYFFPLSSHHHFPPRVIRKLYSTVFDSDQDGLISFPDFVIGISKCIHGQRRHKMRLVFDIFDVDNDGMWSFREGADFLRTGMLYVKHLTLDSLEEVDMRDMLQEQQFLWWQEELKSMQQHLQQDSQSDPLASSPNSNNSSPTNAASPNPSSSPNPSAASPLLSNSNSAPPLISFSAFRSWSTRLFRFRPFLARFDVLPTPRQECARIKQLWNETETVMLGQTWYVLSETWWRTWKVYTGFKEPGEEDTPTTAAVSDTISPPYLISDTDTDSDHSLKTSPRHGPMATPHQAPSTPYGPSRTASRMASSPAGIHVGGLSSDERGSITNGATATTTKIGTVRVHSFGVAPATSSPQTASLAPPVGGTAAPNLTLSPGALSPISPVLSKSALAALRPTAIDNTDLQSPSNPLLLRTPLVEHEDFILLNEAVWKQLYEWYGLASTHSAFPRSVIEVGRDGARIRRVELYPLCLRIKRVGKEAPQPMAHPGVPVEGACLLFPDASHFTAQQLEQRLIDLFYATPPPSTSNKKEKRKSKEKEISRPDSSIPRSIRIWIREGNDYRCLLLEDLSKSLMELEFQDNDVLLVELERERKKGSSGASPLSWYMDKRKIPRSWTQFEVGDTIDARDKQNTWYKAFVKTILPPQIDGKGESSITVRFDGWDEKWNETFPVSSLCRCRGPCSCNGRLAAPGCQIRFKKADPTSPNDSPDVGHPANGNSVVQKGLCGLQNLGNTCFLNSTLQCLSNTPYFISNYFLNNKHLHEINKSNALGHKGQLAMEFGNLMREMWSGNSRAIAPSKFKRVISDFAPQFDGYNQHDSHELLAFLLDGLHEDLNRVLKKVPTTAVESNGRTDSVVVRESWSVYKIRNQSIVVDLFMGMLKSTVICPEPTCGRVSITFDPFRYLTVPLPQFTDRQFIITFCNMTSSPLVNYGIILPDHATVGQLKERLAQLCGSSVHKLMICDVHKSKLYRVLMDTKRVSTIRENDVLVAYEILPEAFREVAATPSTSVASNSSSISLNSASSQTSSSSTTSNGSSSPVNTTPPVLKENMIYLQAIHKYIMVDARGNQSMSPRFGIPICLTTTPHLSNQRIHQLVGQAIDRWTPQLPGRQDLPYTVRIVDHTCSRCGLCAESTNCGGCCLPEDDRPCNLDGAFALCILWETDLIAQQVKARMDDAHIIDHPSVHQKVRTDAPLRLKDCLELFSAKETLSKEDAWFCSKCKQHKQATKQLQVFHTPEVLIVHLKRFIQINRIRREKLTTMVDFPIKGLDLSPFIPQHAREKENEPYPIYDLFAISNHSGGLSGGHYYSYCLNPETKKWFYFDDSRVSEITDVQRIKTPYAYMLMYKRRS